MTTSANLVMRARDAGVVLTTAESCTGGLLAAAITDAAGASDIYDRGIITYSNAAKKEMLGVSQTTLDSHGAVSEETAREMAEGALSGSDADIGIAITGVAGPGGSDAKPEGLVCFALARHGADTVSETLEFGVLGRENVRRASVDHAMDMLGKAVG
jgi:nicotinamide-nucleotide amidase